MLLRGDCPLLQCGSFPALAFPPGQFPIERRWWNTDLGGNPDPCALLRFSMNVQPGDQPVRGAAQAKYLDATSRAWVSMRLEEAPG